MVGENWQQLCCATGARFDKFLLCFMLSYAQPNLRYYSSG